MSITANFNRSVVLSSLLLFAGTRILGDSLLFITQKLDTDTIVIWKTVSTLSIIFSAILYLFINFLKSGKFSEKVSSEEYFKDIFKIILFSGTLLLIKIFLPETVSTYLLENSILHLVWIDLVTMLFIFTSSYTFYFLYKWAFMRMHKKTKYLIKALIVVYIVLFFCDIFNSFIDSNIFQALKIICLLCTTVIIYKLYNNSWIALLPKTRKLNLLWISLSIMVIAIILTTIILDNETNLHSALVYFMGGTSVVTGFPFFCAIVYFLKIFFSTIGALPTSEIVERKTYEIKSLAYLNKIIAETIDFDNLLRTITQLAISSSSAHFAWVEIYKKKQKIDKVFTENLSTDDVFALHEITDFALSMKEINKPFLIQSITDESKIYPIFANITFAGSMIIVPLYHKFEKIGNLVVLSREEYGLDNDDINVLTAFSDNVSIAIENAKLLEDSIEKEKYKQEITLAKGMQDKLLPRDLPQVNNYSISAYTKSAELVGGDYYDYVYLKNDKLCLLIGDVSGKGISAAFYMAQLKGVVLSVSKESETASDILKRINATLHGKMDKQMYITLSAVVIDDEDGNISFARAGHMPTILKTSTGISFNTPKGFGVGLVSEKLFNPAIEEVKAKLNPNDICFLFTDGVNELRNEKDEDFGYDSLKQILNVAVYDNAGSLINNLKEEIERFSGNSHQLDDITMLTIVYNRISNENA
jgi:phosphoserine phosphatase RsbU/P